MIHYRGWCVFNYLAGKQGLPDPKLPTHFYFRNLPISNLPLSLFVHLVYFALSLSTLEICHFQIIFCLCLCILSTSLVLFASQNLPI